MSPSFVVPGLAALAVGLALPATIHAQDEADPVTSSIEASPDAAAAEAAPETSIEPPPSAPPTEAEMAEARHAFEVASAAFENGDYETASTEFRTAYELSRHPTLLYNVYLAEERAGRPGEAAMMLERYLELGDAQADERAVLERRLERLRTRAASRAPVVDPTESEADRAALLVAPTDVDGTAWRVVERPPGGPPVAGVALLVTGGVLLVGFAVLAPLSEVEDQRLAGSCGRAVGRFCTAEETSTLLALDVAADVAWIAGAATAVVGLVLLFALPPERGEAAPIALAPWLVPTAGGGALAGLTASGRF